LKNIKIIDSVLEDESKATIGNLFDEPDKFAFKPSYMNGMYFDEIYHAGRLSNTFTECLLMKQPTHLSGKSS